MIGDGKDPCDRLTALARMRMLSTIKAAHYQFGTGNYHPATLANGTTSPVGYALEYDCAGAALDEAYMLTRHRKGFASGTPPYPDMNDVDDDINTNSALEDAFGKQELFELVLEGPMLPGDLVMWATIHIKGHDGAMHTFIGHVLMASFVPDGWTVADGFYRCHFLQCCGGNGRTPAVIETDGSSIDKHNRDWPKDGHRAYIVRVKAPAPAGLAT